MKIRDLGIKLEGMVPNMGVIKKISDRLKKQSVDSSPMDQNSTQLNSTINDLPLIMDIGMNNGRDSRFYLEKGFRVIAVEANPILVKSARQEFAEYIASGQLIIEPIGLGLEEGKFTFYQNLDNDHWSSFIKGKGTREGTSHKEIVVKCRPPQFLFEKYGMPYYLKIDIEGFDIEVVRALHDFRDRPRYISIEEEQLHDFAELWAVGCRSFKLVNQNTLWLEKCPNPPLEGSYVDAQFDGTTSGPFGEEAPGDWMSFADVVEKYINEVRSSTLGFLGGNDWFDIHGRVEI